MESAGATRCYSCRTSNAVGFTFFPSFERGSLRCETSLFAFESNENSEVDCMAPRLVESASIYILMTISAYSRDEVAIETTVRGEFRLLLSTKLAASARHPQTKSQTFMQAPNYLLHPPTIFSRSFASNRSLSSSSSNKSIEMSSGDMGTAENATGGMLKFSEAIDEG